MTTEVTNPIEEAVIVPLTEEGTPPASEDTPANPGGEPEIEEIDESELNTFENIQAVGTGKKRLRKKKEEPVTPEAPVVETPVTQTPATDTPANPVAPATEEGGMVVLNETAEEPMWKQLGFSSEAEAWEFARNAKTTPAPVVQSDPLAGLDDTTRALLEYQRINNIPDITEAADRYRAIVTFNTETADPMEVMIRHYISDGYPVEVAKEKAREEYDRFSVLPDVNPAKWEYYNRTVPKCREGIKAQQEEVKSLRFTPPTPAATEVPSGNSDAGTVPAAFSAVESLVDRWDRAVPFVPGFGYKLPGKALEKVREEAKEHLKYATAEQLAGLTPEALDEFMYAYILGQSQYRNHAAELYQKEVARKAEQQMANRMGIGRESGTKIPANPNAKVPDGITVPHQIDEIEKKLKEAYYPNGIPTPKR